MSGNNRKSFSRRSFLRQGACSTAAIGALTLWNKNVLAETARQGKRPNILLIFPDDHGYQAISAYDKQLIDTPNIDRIAKGGTRFDRCYVTNSLCAPSRATVQTGKYSFLNGVMRNSREGHHFFTQQPTFPKILQKNGYQTALIGKWHLEVQPPGYDYSYVFPGQGRYYNPEFIENGKKKTMHGYATDLVADKVLDWLKHMRNPEKPFLLCYQPKTPHAPQAPAPRFMHLFEDRKIPEPPTYFDTYAGRGPGEHHQDMELANPPGAAGRLFTNGRMPAGMDEEQKRVWNAVYGPKNEAMENAHLDEKAQAEWNYQRYMKNYLRCVAALDENVGRVLDYLDQSGLAENTLVIYSSDQGVFLGEHGWFDKRWAYQESLRSPLLVRWPGITQPGSVAKDIVSNLDFAETILDAAGVPVPDDMQGRSFVSILKGEPPDDWRKTFYYHYYEYPDWHKVPPHYAVRTDRYLLIHFYGPYDYWELFDEKKDPREMKNEYDNPEYADVVKRLKGEMKQLQVKHKDTDPTRSIESIMKYLNKDMVEKYGK